MGDKSPKSKNRIKIQKNAAKAQQQAKKNKRQASYASEKTDTGEPVKKVS